MKGSRTTAERKRLLHDMSAVICVSDYIRGCFLDGLDVAASLAGKVQTARNGVNRWLAAPVIKTPMVLFVGRMVPEKGILEFGQALAEVLQDYPEWSVVIVGARQFDTSKPGSYENQVAEALTPLGARASMTGFLPLDKVKGLQQEAAIIACPSIWEEPLGKTGIEALAAGSALLTTRRGGIPEVAAGRAHIVDSPSPHTFAEALRKLIGDDDYRARLQQIAWDDFPFTATAMASVADRIRIDAIKRSCSTGK
jgi:glycosyltransferase involved in cell wall biosynthesis